MKRDELSDISAESGQQIFASEMILSFWVGKFPIGIFNSRNPQSLGKHQLIIGQPDKSLVSPYKASPIQIQVPSVKLLKFLASIRLATFI